jgi:hypothetical protein
MASIVPAARVDTLAPEVPRITEALGTAGVVDTIAAADITAAATLTEVAILAEGVRPAADITAAATLTEVAILAEGVRPAADITAVAVSTGAATLGEDILVEPPAEHARQMAERGLADIVNPTVEDARAVEAAIKAAVEADIQVAVVDTPAAEVAGIKVAVVEVITGKAIPA